MGWDVVEIGLKHDLPFEDPMATAKAVAQRLNMNINVLFRNEYAYDKEKNIVTDSKLYEEVELGRFQMNDSDKFIPMMIENYQINQWVKEVGIEKLRKAIFVDNSSEKLNFLTEVANDTDIYYDIEDREEPYLTITIYPENVDLGISVCERWKAWLWFITHMDEFKDVIHNYRMQIYERAQLFGCKEVIICADQGPGIMIFANMDMPANKLKSYVRNYEYLMNYGWIKNSTHDEWRKNARHIMFSSVFQGNLKLSKDEFIEVIYDDFADIRTIQKDVQ